MSTVSASISARMRQKDWFNIRAFTGMLIGTFKIEEETETSIIVKTSGTKKVLEFDKATGIQLNANNKRYANCMEIL